MKVHVIVRQDVQRDPVARRATLHRILEAGHLELDNPERFEQLGILTASAAPDTDLEAIRGLDGVEAVEVDQLKHAR